MKALSYTKVTQTAEAAVRAQLKAAAKKEEVGDARGARDKREAAAGAFDLWVVLVLDHLDALGRASYATEFARLYSLVCPEHSPA